jgi:transcriptional regulator with XRE-family HTH domain
LSSDEAGPPRPAAQSLAARLDRRFSLTTDSVGREHSYRAVAAAIEAAGGPTVSASYLHQLRTGQKDNPTKHHLEALASYFGVPPAYFFDDGLAAEVDAQLELLRTLQDSGVMSVAVRARGLSEESLKVLSDLIDRTRRLEGLDDSGGGRARSFKPRPRPRQP